MMSSTVSVQIPPAPTYGAVEIKEFIRRNTLRGLLLTIGMLVFLLVIYFVYGKVTEPESVVLKKAPISRLNINIAAPQQTEEQQDAPPPPPQDAVIQYATAARAGMPVPVPDAEIKEDLKEFASVDEMSKSLAANEGVVIDLNQLPSNIELDKQVEVKKEEIPDEDEFVPVEKEPVVDLEDLQKRIVYPEMARRAGIEGKVVVRVFVTKNGKPLKFKVQYSDSQMLDKAAVDAVMKGVYVPAIQNGQPVGVWVSIPVNFKLK